MFWTGGWHGWQNLMNAPNKNWLFSRSQNLVKDFQQPACFSEWIVGQDILGVMDVKRCEWRTYGFLPGVVKPKDLLMRTLLFHKCAQVISENMHQPLGLAGCPSEFFLDGVSLNTLERVFLHISALQRGKASATVFSRFFFKNFSFEGPSKQASQPASQHASTQQASKQTHKHTPT